jgi:hypothetical protein
MRSAAAIRQADPKEKNGSKVTKMVRGKELVRLVSLHTADIPGNPDSALHVTNTVQITIANRNSGPAAHRLHSLARCQSRGWVREMFSLSNKMVKGSVCIGLRASCRVCACPAKWRHFERYIRTIQKLSFFLFRAYDAKRALGWAWREVYDDFAPVQKAKGEGRYGASCVPSGRQPQRHHSDPRIFHRRSRTRCAATRRKAQPRRPSTWLC